MGSIKDCIKYLIKGNLQKTKKQWKNEAFLVDFIRSTFLTVILWSFRKKTQASEGNSNGISAGSLVCHATFHSQGLLGFNERSCQDTIPLLYEFVIIRRNCNHREVVSIMDFLLAELDRKRKQIDQNEVTSVSIFKLELQYERNVWLEQNQLE